MSIFKKAHERRKAEAGVEGKATPKKKEEKKGKATQADFFYGTSKDLKKKKGK
jgi:hypothetical protein